MWHSLVPRSWDIAASPRSSINFLSINDIARQSGYDRKTIRKYIKNQIHKFLDAAGIALSLFVSDIFCKSGMHILRGLVARKRIPSNRIRKRARLLPVLMSVPGVKFIAAITVLAEIGNYRDFKDGDQLAGYSGLTPTVDSSGGKNTLGKITKHGSRHLRWILNQVAHGASKTKKSRMSRVYLRLLRRNGKPKAITALARKVISIMHHLLINREMWKEEGFKKRRLDFDFNRTSSSSQLTWVDLLFNNVVRTGKGKSGGGG